MEETKNISSITPKWLYTALLLAGLYVIVPLLLISAYNQPAGDDYFTAVRDAGTSFGSALHDSYLYWSGRYFALVVARLNPMLYHAIAAYKIYPALLLVLFAGALLALLRQVCGKYFSLKQQVAITAVAGCIYINAMPSVAEGFYWFSSAWVYQLANVLFMLLLVVLVKLTQASAGSKQWLLFACATILCICIVGLNEISLIITFLTVAAFAWFAQRRWLAAKKMFIALVIICFTAGCISGLAPGNFERLNHQQEYSSSLLWTFAGGLSIAAVYTLQWLAQLFVATLLYIPFWGIPLAQKMVNNGACFTVKLRKVIAVIVGIYILLQLFTVWTAGGSNAGRIQNVIYLYFLFGYFFTLQLYLVQRIQNGKPAILTYPFLVVKIAAALFFVSLADINGNISTAWMDILSGKAKKYDWELTHRATMANQCAAGDTCIVPALTAIPKTIFFEDIKSRGDSADLWLNNAYRDYFKSGYILTDAPLPPVEPNMETLKNMGKEIREMIFDK